MKSKAEQKPTLEEAPSSPEKTWQQTKSEQTRMAILDAAIGCFYELGYANTTTDNIARQAGVSRGAMLHHFPTRFDLIKAAVRYLSDKRLARFMEEESRVNRGAEHTRVGEGIDAFWAQLNSPEWVVFHELKVAARTDKELEAALVPALAEFEKALYEAATQIFPDLLLSEAFDRGNLLTTYLLEGMAAAKLVQGSRVPEKKMLDWLKRELVRSYQDVLTTVKRPDSSTAD
ncbi:MAG: TetR/AcrR family transcriptional regulator [Pseudomonadota bacterium]